MYYYGYNGAYSTTPYNYGGCYTPYTGNNNGYGAAIILVLFILLVVVFGAGFINNGNN